MRELGLKVHDAYSYFMPGNVRLTAEKWRDRDEVEGPGGGKVAQRRVGLIVVEVLGGLNIGDEVPVYLEALRITTAKFCDDAGWREHARHTAPR